MAARRSSSDPVSRHLASGERIVWRHQPSPRVLFYNRLPAAIIVLLMTTFVVVIGVNVVRTSIGPGPWEAGPWLILPAVPVAFFGFLLFFFLRFLWGSLRSLLDSWSTLYALTDRRFLVVSKRGLVAYGAPYFRIMQASGGAPGQQVLLFDYGPSGGRRRDTFRDRIAGLPDSQKLERLIRETLRA
jgi:hypothetical protein